MKQPQNVIKKILLTEKGARLTEQDNKYLFLVQPGSNKLEIKRAIETLFKVGVVKVNTLGRPGKFKRNRQSKPGMTSDTKRAVVTLKTGDKIDLT